MILDNLNHHKNPIIRQWCEANRVELLFTPTYASWANPIEAHFGPLRQFVLANSDHPDHPALARAIRRYLTWRNANTRDPASSTLNDVTAPASAANSNDDGDDHDQPPHEPREPLVVRALDEKVHGRLIRDGRSAKGLPPASA